MGWRGGGCTRGREERGVSRPAPRPGPAGLGAIFTAAGAWRGARTARPRTILPGGSRARCPGHIPGEEPRGSHTGTVPTAALPPQPSPCRPHVPPPSPNLSTTEASGAAGPFQPRRCPRLTHILRPRPRRFPAPPPTARGGGAGGGGSCPSPAPRCPPTGGHRPTGRDPRGGRHLLPGAAGASLGGDGTERNGAHPPAPPDEPSRPWGCGSPVTLVPRGSRGPVPMGPGIDGSRYRWGPRPRVRLRGVGGGGSEGRDLRAPHA